MTLDVRGKTVVLTGTFSRLGRADAEAQLVALGAKIGGGVTKATHVLFAGGKAGSKIDAASKLGVTVLGEDDLMAVLRGGASEAAAEKVREKATGKTKAPRGKQATTWPPVGGSLDEVVGLLEGCVKKIAGGYHAGEFRRDLAVRAMMLGLFERAAAAIEGGPDWVAAWDPWWSAYARGATVVAALGRSDEAVTGVQRKTLRRWLVEGEAALSQIGPTWTACRPQALLGAGWVLLGEREHGEGLLAAALAGVDPEDNVTEHRALVAEAYAALGRVGAAIEVLTGSPTVRWTYAAPAIAAICHKASAAELELLRVRMAERQDQTETILFNRGLDRLIALQEWDAARAWLAGFPGLATWLGEVRLVATMFTVGQVARAETGRLVDPADPRCAEVLQAMTHLNAKRAELHLERIFDNARVLIGAAGSPQEFLAALAGAAVQLGRLELAARVEALGRDRGEMQAVRLQVLWGLEPADPAWGEWWKRACDGAPDSEKVRLAAIASRAKLAEADALLGEAIEVARKGYAADLDLMEVSRKMAEAGDLAGAHRAWLAIPKGRRSARSGWLIDACVTMGAWAGALELLAAMPMDLNGAPGKANQILRRLTGGED